MKNRDRVGFRELVRTSRAEGLSLTAAIERAYAWLLKPSRDLFGHPLGTGEALDPQVRDVTRGK